MNYFKTSKTPFLSGAKLKQANSTPLVNNTLYRKLVGYLLYLNHTPPDIYYLVSVAYRDMDNPHDVHWIESNKIFHFVQGTNTQGIHYVAKYDLELVGFTSYDWACDKTDRK